MAQGPWGRESRDHLRRITPRSVGLIESDKDRYGRIVEAISSLSGETSINLEMVEAGQAAVYPRYCKDPAFYAAERRTREARLGIWEKEGAQQRPWEVRR
jgi:endonuclease YncB( thermonuclease family)